MTWWFNLTLVLLLVSNMVCSEKIDLTFAVVLKLDAMFRPQMNKAVELAIEDLNNRDDVLPNSHITLVYTPLSIEVESNENLRVFSDFFLSNPDILGLVGLYNANMATAASLVADIVRIPMLTTSTSPEFSDKEKYPYYARAVGESQGGFVAMAKLIQEVGFQRIAYVGTDDLTGTSGFQEFSEDLHTLDIQLITSLYHESLEEAEAPQIIHQLDAILDELSEAGARVIVYNGHFDEVQLMLYRAWKKGMLGKNSNGDIIQWILTEDACFDGLFTECVDEDCKASMPFIKLKAAGTFCIMGEIPIEEEWYETVWLPNTTKDKLTQNEIDISGTDDWDKYYNPQSVFSYDSTTLLGHALHNFCNDNDEYISYEECLKDLKNRGSDVMKEFPKVSFKGATGDISLNEQYEREMNQEIFQWTGTTYELASEWIIHKSDTDEDHFVKEADYRFASMDGSVPPTAFEQGAGSVIIAFCIGSFILCCVAGCYMFYLLRKYKTGKTKRKVRGFLNNGSVTWIMACATLFLVIQLIGSLITIGPKGLFVPMFTMVNYLGDFPLIVLLGGLLSKSYRYSRVTNNRKMKRIKFGNHHSLKCVSGCLLFCLIVSGAHYFGSGFHSDGTWNEKYQLQDVNPIHFFELPSTEFDSCSSQDFLTWVYLSCMVLLNSSLAVGLTVLLHLSLEGIVAPSMRKVVHKEIALVRILGLVIVIMQFRRVLFLLFNVDNGNDADHTGFENGNCKMSLSGARIDVLGRYVEAFSIWICCFLTCYLGYLRAVTASKPKRRKSSIVHPLGDRNHSSSSCSSRSVMTTNTNTTTNHNSVGYQLPQNLWDRLSGIRRDDSGTHSKYKTVNNDLGGSELSRTGGSRSTTISIQPASPTFQKVQATHFGTKKSR
eukprot:TRINITY_DN111503_c0_g1_i5.p1 TRINITY_DN111503_c0_g1~~TRINITY_DN111503_c0_g1_i5.p1  ORF type:complete len:887 (+),score=162.40 TRINITY_DN111503_c0_g1_i5:196-2856(+)